LRRLVVAVVVGVMVGGGLMAVTPAGAEVSQSLATSWKKIWKKELRPLADKRYYTKKKSDSTFATKAESAAAAAAAQSAASSATDSKLGSYYKKTESDARYAPAQALYRGSYQIMGTSPAAAHGGAASVSWGATFPAALTPHYIKSGDPVPSGCSGSSTEPNAAPGNFCVFESLASNVSANRSVCRGAAPASCGTTDPWGAGIYTYTAAAGSFYVYGTWAARPSGPVVNPARTSPSRSSAPASGDPTLAGR
jgi:hypothetical protein